MNTFSKLATAGAIALLTTITVSGVAFAQSTGGGYGGGNGGGYGGQSPGGAPEKPAYEDPKKGFNPIINRAPPTYYYQPQLNGDETCELLRMQITQSNALVTVPRYRECLRRHGQPLPR